MKFVSLEDIKKVGNYELGELLLRHPNLRCPYAEGDSWRYDKWVKLFVDHNYIYDRSSMQFVKCRGGQAQLDRLSRGKAQGGSDNWDDYRVGEEELKLRWNDGVS